MSEYVMPTLYPDKVLDLAREFVNSPLSENVFTENEDRVLGQFFSNPNGRVFFMFHLPANLGATLLAMFSRLKNKRGLRGIFVDSFLPQLLATDLSEVDREFNGNEINFLKTKNIKTLDEFIDYSEEAQNIFEIFLRSVSIDMNRVMALADSKKAKIFLKTWLDSYGHNSIARMASLWICFEQVSLMAAKSIEWCRPGAGYVELSTRYVDMSAKGTYPVERELAVGWGIDPETVLASNELSFALYNKLAGNNFDGPFPTFIRERYVNLYQDLPKDLESGVIGETCDVLGNLLPASALTSLGVNINGEAFPVLLKHLLLDKTPENVAIAELLLTEAHKFGIDQFAAHVRPSEWERANWFYPDTEEFAHLLGTGNNQVACLYNKSAFQHISLSKAFPFRIRWVQRNYHDKLPRSFESVTVPFKGVMSFRSWRDLQRQGFCTHIRSLVTTKLGFYKYDKPAPTELFEAFKQVYECNVALEKDLETRQVTPMLRQFPLALGNNVGFEISGNLRQLEFCTWQRSKFSVNHEVRQKFLGIENELCNIFSWWSYMASRADMTPAYVFARGSKGIQLTQSPL